MQRPAHRRDDEAEPHSRYGPGENRDENAERGSEGDVIESRRAKGQADACLEGCSEAQGGETTNQWLLPESLEQWTFCGPTHQI